MTGRLRYSACFSWSRGIVCVACSSWRWPSVALGQPSAQRNRLVRRSPTSCSSSRMTWVGPISAATAQRTSVRRISTASRARVSGSRTSMRTASPVLRRVQASSPGATSSGTGSKRRCRMPRAPATAACRATGYSLPQLLKNHGYATALIGKWHLGYVEEKSPNAHGFDYFFGLKSGYHDYYTHHDGEGQPDLWENDHPIESSWLHDGSRHAARRPVHRRAQERALLPRRRLHGAALALPGAGQPVGCAGQCSPRHAA